MIRLGFLAALGVILAGVIAAAQDRKPIGGVETQSVAIFNPVEGRMVVVSAKPDGARVEVGDIVCEFDSGDLSDRLASQQLVVSGAQAEVNGTRIAREVAVMALHEFKEGVFRSQLATTEGQIKLAESRLSQAEEHLDWSRRMFTKGYVSLAENVSGELALKQAVFALEEAQCNKKALIEFSKEKHIKTLMGAIESARARELAAQAAIDREQRLQKKLSAQIDRCKVKAPVAGRVKYTTPLSTGAVVFDGNLIFHVVTDAAAARSKVE
jgi:HlyD family secretion protein